MILYYNNPDNQNEKTNVYIDFHTLHNRVKRQYPESKLYRLLRKRCSTFRYQNRDLYPYEEIIRIPELYKEMKRDDYENPNIWRIFPVQTEEEMAKENIFWVWPARKETKRRRAY